MPWRESSPMSERLDFITACLNRSDHIVSICDRFGISEKTGQKWLRRFREAGPRGLEDRSHARHSQAHRMSLRVEERIVELRRKYPLYGPEKLRDWLVQHEPETRWPAPSSIGDLLKRRKLVRSKRRRNQEHSRLAGRRAQATEPNSIWTADFKGEFRLGSDEYCYPLTVLDLYTHYLLGCTALRTTAVTPARQVFVRLFREHGLPKVLRTDNGVPFAQPNALGRLGSLALWWVRLGIRPEHITPARPAENGAHERFHKTLKQATTRPAAASFGAQQRRFDSYRAEYNSERPHAALPQHRPPADYYSSSALRPYPARLPPLVYPSDRMLRLVDANGNIKWRNQPFFLSTNLAGEYVALMETDSDLVTVSYAALALGEIDPHLSRFIPRVRWTG